MTEHEPIPDWAYTPMLVQNACSLLQMAAEHLQVLTVKAHTWEELETASEQLLRDSISSLSLGPDSEAAQEVAASYAVTLDAAMYALHKALDATSRFEAHSDVWAVIDERNAAYTEGRMSELGQLTVYDATHEHQVEVDLPLDVERSVKALFAAIAQGLAPDDAQEQIKSLVLPYLPKGDHAEG